MKRSLYLLCLLLPFFSCGNATRPGSSNTSNDSAALSESDTIVTPSGPYFYKQFSGSLGDDPIVLQLTRYGGLLSGVFYYTGKTGPQVQLFNWNDTLRNDSEFVLRETGREPILLQHGEDAVWAMTLSGRTLNGTWKRGDGTEQRPIHLKEQYPKGSVVLFAHWLQDSLALWPDRKQSPKAESSYGYLMPPDGHNQFLNDALREQITNAQDAHSPEPIEALLRREMDAYFAGYRKDNQDIQLNKEDGFSSAILNYTQDEMMQVRYNADDWLVTEINVSTYTGGAHGYSASSFSNIDLAQKKVWQLTEMVGDTAALRPLLDDAAIAYFDLKPGMSLSEALLVDDVYATMNVHVGASGLSFVYVPYEIAPYADGQVTLFIPYSRLVPLLTSSFRERMHLDSRSGTALLPHSKFSTHGAVRHT